MLGVRVRQTPLLDLNKVIGEVKPWNSEVQNGIFRIFVLSNTILALDLSVEALKSVDTSTSGVLEDELERRTENLWMTYLLLQRTKNPLLWIPA